MRWVSAAPVVLLVLALSCSTETGKRDAGDALATGGQEGLADTVAGEARPAVEEPPIRGTTYRLVELDDVVYPAYGSGWGATPEGRARRPWVRFDGPNRLVAFDGCHARTGTWFSQEGELRLDGQTLTTSVCADASRDVERSVVDVLESGPAVVGVGDRLRIGMMELEAQPSPAEVAAFGAGARLVEILGQPVTHAIVLRPSRGSAGANLLEVELCPHGGRRFEVVDTSGLTRLVLDIRHVADLHCDSELEAPDDLDLVWRVLRVNPIVEIDDGELIITSRDDVLTFVPGDPTAEANGTLIDDPGVVVVRSLQHGPGFFEGTIGVVELWDAERTAIELGPYASTEQGETGTDTESLDDDVHTQTFAPIATTPGRYRLVLRHLLCPEEGCTAQATAEYLTGGPSTSTVRCETLIETRHDQTLTITATWSSDDSTCQLTS